jgi:heptosyltransferase-2
LKSANPLNSKMRKAHKILFITLSNIGDCILTLPVLDCLRRDHPGAEIMVIVGPRPAQIFQESLSVNKVFVYDKHAKLKEKISLLKKLRGQKFDLIVDLRNSIFPWLLSSRKKNSCFFRPAKLLRHMTERHLARIFALGVKSDRIKAPAKALFVRFQDDDYISQLLKMGKINGEDKIITVSSGARSPTKRWPQDKFVDLINGLPAEYKIVLIGDRQDEPVNNFISRNTRSAVLDLTGRTSILQAAALLKRSALLITNDSANLHLASYLDIPVVAIFGPTDEFKYGPWSSKFRVAKKEIFCRPCRKAQCRYATLECLQRVSPEEVLRQVKSVLAEGVNPQPRPTAPYQYKRILIVRTDRIGDVILSTPVIKALRDAYPGAYLAMVVRPYTKVIIEGNPYLDDVILYDKDGREKSWFSALRFSRNLAKSKFDLAVVLNPSNRSNLIPFLAGIPKRVGYDRKLGWLLTDRVKDTKFEGKKHEIEYNLDLVRALGIQPRDTATFMPILQDSEKWVEAVLNRENIQPSDRLVVINPGASDNSKMWPPKRYAQVADKLSEKKMKVIILGGAGDEKICREVISGMHCQYIDMVGNNNISQAASLLKRSSLFISSDTGPMHIASSCGIPVLAILGRSQAGLSPLRWGPHNKNSGFIHKDVGCAKCLAHKCSKNFLCLQAITVEDVLELAEKLLKNS